MSAFETMLEEVRGCQACGPKLPLGARPVLQASKAARLLLRAKHLVQKFTVRASLFRIDLETGCGNGQD